MVHRNVIFVCLLGLVVRRLAFGSFQAEHPTPRLAEAVCGRLFQEDLFLQLGK